MEFLSKYDGVPPKNLFPCLATITIGDPRPARRMSGGSFSGKSDDGADDGGNALKRVISGGGRRKSSFGAAASAGQTAEERRASLAPGNDHNAKGTWYWRVQAGVTDSQLVLLPLSQPPNPILTQPPPPLSQAMPAHSAQPVGGTKAHGATAGTHDANAHNKADHHEEGLIDKLKHMFRRGSNAEEDRHAHAATEVTSTSGAAATTTSTAGATAATYDQEGQAGGIVPNKDGKVDKILDQTAQGQQLPTAGANAIGATNVNANAETGFPGVLPDGQKCGAIVVGVNNVDKHKVELKGGRAHEGSWVNVPVTSHFASMIQGMGEYSAPKSGFIRLEFDKDWIGAKGEAEVLHFNLTDAITKRSSPMPPTLQLPFGGGHPNPGVADTQAARAHVPASTDPIAPHEIVAGAGMDAPHTASGTTGVAPPLTGGHGLVAGGAPGANAVDTTPDASDRKVPGPV